MEKDRINRIVESVFKKYIKENSDNWEDTTDDIDPYEEYENDYHNTDFAPNEITNSEVMQFCADNDFFYISDGVFGGLKLRVCNTNNETREFIINDINNCDLIPTHKYDNLIYNKLDFRNNYVVVFEVIGSSENYAIVYETPIL